MTRMAEHIERLELENAERATRVAELKSENAGLRELVRNYHSAMRCTLDTGIWPTDPEWLERCMRELGIEVTE